MSNLAPTSADSGDNTVAGILVFVYVQPHEVFSRIPTPWSSNGRVVSVRCRLRSPKVGEPLNSGLLDRGVYPLKGVFEGERA